MSAHPSLDDVMGRLDLDPLGAQHAQTTFERRGYDLGAAVLEEGAQPHLDAVKAAAREVADRRAALLAAEAELDNRVDEALRHAAPIWAVARASGLTRERIWMVIDSRPPPPRP